jgi:hypothetical protein
MGLVRNMEVMEETKIKCGNDFLKDSGISRHLNMKRRMSTHAGITLPVSPSRQGMRQIEPKSLSLMKG